MKTFIAALVTLALLIAAVTANGLFISHRTAGLLEVCELLPRLPAGGLAEADDEVFERALHIVHQTWDTCRFLVCLSVSHAEAQEIDGRLTEVAVRWRCGEKAGYESARQALCDAIRELRKSEFFSLEGIM